jgi:membrane fusion protein (multidrug efflux system)
MATQDSASAAPAPAAAPPPANGRRNRLPGLVFGAVVVALVLGIGIYWLMTHGTVSTDDAYTDGDAITIAPKVPGYVTQLAIGDNTRVKAGQLLVEIDPRDFTLARDKAAAALALDQAQLATAQANLDIARVRFPADLASAEAAAASARAGRDKAAADLDRQKKVDARATTQQQIDAATLALRTAEAQLADAEAKRRTADLVPQNIAAAEAQVRQLAAAADQAKADLAQAELNLSYSRITAPQDGWVTKRNVQLGSYLQVGQSLFSLVSPRVWVTANFKESQLAGMRPGQPARIRIDAYPDLDLEGHVDSIQMGTGSRFTAFPAENATGNYVKIVQRVPVKIVIDRGLDPNLPLPLGLSVDPVVDVR